MKVGLFGNAQTGHLVSLAKAIKAAGHRPVFRNPQFYGPDQWEPFDLVVASGDTEKTRLLAAHCTIKEVPFFLSDVGYLRRENYFRVAVNNFNWLPPVDMPSDRFDALGFEISKMRAKTDGAVLVLASGEKNKPTADEWLFDTAALVSGELKASVKVRRHPFEQDEEESLNDALAAAQVAVCFDSNAANEALLAGVPVICPDTAQYSELSATISGGKLVLPSDKAVRRYFNRLAYCQWTALELANGEAYRFMLDVAGLGGPAEIVKTNDISEKEVTEPASLPEAKTNAELEIQPPEPNVPEPEPNVPEPEPEPPAPKKRRGRPRKENGASNA